MSADELPSWRETTAEQSIVEFVAVVTDPDSPDLVPERDRVAVFDNDGTLWTERPVYAQLVFALDRAAELGHPTSMEELHAGGMAALIELVALTHAGITTDEFDALCQNWLASARHPRFGRPYPATVYQPMLELLGLLDRNGFSCWIFSGGGTDFMRAWTADAYGLPPHRVIGSVGETEFRVGNSGPELVKTAKVGVFDDGRKSQARFTGTSGSARLWPPGTPTATWPCSSGPQPARAGPCNWSSTTPTATGSTPTTVIRSSAAAPTRSSLPPPSTSGLLSAWRPTGPPSTRTPR